MPRRRPRVRRSTTSDTEWRPGAPSLPDEFTLAFKDDNLYDYTYRIDGATHYLKDLLLDEARNPPLGEQWDGLAQPETIECQSDGTVPLTPAHVFCSYEHEHVIPRRVQGDGEFDGRRQVTHRHEFTLDLFVSATDRPEVEGRFGWYAPHLIHGVAE